MTKKECEEYINHRFADQTVDTLPKMAHLFPKGWPGHKKIGPVLGTLIRRHCKILFETFYKGFKASPSTYNGDHLIK